jgi:hypothetical protein
MQSNSNLCAAFIGAMALAALQGPARPANAHGISGNRFFPGTMAFDDPAVADELLVELAQQKHPEDGGLVNDAR